jgi:hypothetical protein
MEKGSNCYSVSCLFSIRVYGKGVELLFSEFLVSYLSSVSVYEEEVKLLVTH